MRIEFLSRNGTLKFELKKILSDFDWNVEPNEVPDTSFTISAEYLDQLEPYMYVNIYVNKKVFLGILAGYEVDKTDEVVKLQVDHQIAEWDFAQIPENIAVKNETVSSILNRAPFLYSNEWSVVVESDQSIDYAYSRQTCLEALTKTCELTSNLYWRVNLCSDEKIVYISDFLDEKNLVLGRNRDIELIEVTDIENDYDNTFNTACVYGEKSNASEASITLRDVYNDVSKQDPDFPVVIWNDNVNNEQRYYRTDIVRFASNNSIEYAIIDAEGLSRMSGLHVERTVSYNDIAPFSLDSEEITDDDRKRAPKQMYDSAVKLLKESRPKEVVTVTVGEMPCEVNVLDKVIFEYKNEIVLFKNCNRRTKRIYEANDYFIVNSIKTRFDENLMETNVLELCKEINKPSKREVN